MADVNVLLVEGKDDEHVFYALLEYYQVPKRFNIHNKEGIDHLLKTLPTELKRSDLGSLGIVVDANTNLGGRWKSLCDILIGAGDVSAPENPDPNGTIFRLQRPDRTVKVGVWLMPDNQLPGMLENFIEFLVPDGDVLWPKAVACVGQLPKEERRFRPQHRQKAHVHTWLAWQEEPGTPLGQAITKRYLDANAPHAQRLIEWICRLFDVNL
jgi:hypothetical protein